MAAALDVPPAPGAARADFGFLTRDNHRGDRAAHPSRRIAIRRTCPINGYRAAYRLLFMTQLMPVPVMNVRKMRVAVRDRQMHMRMRVRLVAVVRKIVHAGDVPCRCRCVLLGVARVCSCRSRSQIPSAISTAAIQNVAGGSAGQSSDSTTPNSGAIEKYAPVRALPR